MTSEAPGGRVTRKSAQMQRNQEEEEETKLMVKTEPNIQPKEETKAVKQGKSSDVSIPAPTAGNEAAAEPAAPSAPPLAVKIEPPAGVNAGPRPVLPGPGPPHVRPPFNPALAGPTPRPVGAVPGLPPGLAPALRGASPAQITEMIAAARQIQQQRLLQMQAAGGSGAPTALPLAAGAGGPRPLVPLATTTAPNTVPPRPPFVMHARPPVKREPGASPTNGVAAAGPFSMPPTGGLLPPPLPGTLKRKSEDLKPAVPGVAMGFPGHLAPPALGQPPAPPAVAAPAPGLSEEVATSAGDQQQQQLPNGAFPATSVSAHFTYGNSGELYGDDDNSGGSGAGVDADGKKVRLVWTQELHNRFINALSHLGLKHAVPKNILTMMNVEGMTRENVASHLQKYRLYLKKIGGHSEKDRIDADILQALHEQNVQHMAAQQAMQQSMVAGAAAAGGQYGFMASLHHAPQHQYTTTAGGGGLEPIDPNAAAPMGAHPGPIASINPSGGSGGGGGSGTGHPSHNINNSGSGGGGGGSGPPTIYIASGDIVEGIPVSDAPVPEPVSPTVTAAVEAGGKFNPQQGWNYPPLPMPDHHGAHPPSGAVMGMPHHQSAGGNGDPYLQQQQQQQQHHLYQNQFNYTPHHHSNLGDLAAAAVGEPQGHDPAPAVWTDNGEGWAEGWPIHQEDEDAPRGDDRDGNKILKNEADKGDGNLPGKDNFTGNDGLGGNANNGAGAGGSGGSGNNNNMVVDDEDDDPPLIPAVPSAGELHHMVERVPMRMGDAA